MCVCVCLNTAQLFIVFLLCADEMDMQAVVVSMRQQWEQTSREVLNQHSSSITAHWYMARLLHDLLAAKPMYMQ